MIAFVILIWFKKLWDYFRPTQDADVSMTTPPDNRFLKWIYDFSFEIMSHAVWRMAIYVMVVIILVSVSLLHLVRNKSNLFTLLLIAAVPETF